MNSKQAFLLSVGYGSLSREWFRREAPSPGVSRSVFLGGRLDQRSLDLSVSGGQSMPPRAFIHSAGVLLQSTFHRACTSWHLQNVACCGPSCRVRAPTTAALVTFLVGLLGTSDRVSSTIAFIGLKGSPRWALRESVMEGGRCCHPYLGTGRDLAMAILVATSITSDVLV